MQKFITIRFSIMMMNNIIKKIIYFIKYKYAQYRKEIIISLTISCGYFIYHEVFFRYFIQKIQSLVLQNDD